MSASLTRRTVSVLAGTAVLALGATPAAAAPQAIDYVNLGDSYSAAIGTGSIGSSLFAEGCLQGDGRDHVGQLDRRQSIDLSVNAACLGATSEDVMTALRHLTVAAALQQAELVTLTVGGNDLEFVLGGRTFSWAEFVMACSTLGDPLVCEALMMQAPEVIARAADNAGTALVAVDNATDGEVVVFGYPRLFEDSQSTQYMSAARAAQLNALTDQLNAAIRAETLDLEDVTFVDVSSHFEGHGIGSADPWIAFDPSTFSDPVLSANNLHPTSRGYVGGYFPALMGSISPGQLGR